MSIIDEHIHLVLKKVLNQSDILHHEIIIERFVDVSALGGVNNARIKFESVFHVRTIKERLKYFSRILFVGGNVINVNSSSKIND